jgi:hypothetical protein
VGQAGNQKTTNKEQSPTIAELREELRRKIAAHAMNAGAHVTAILGLTLYPPNCTESLLSRNV